MAELLASWSLLLSGDGVLVPSPEPKSREEAELKIAGARNSPRAGAAEDSAEEEKYLIAYTAIY